MKLLFKESLTEYKETPTVEDIIMKTNELLGEDLYFSHYVADGVEVNEAPKLFLEQNLLTINQLEVISIHAKEFINELLLSSEEYTNRSLPYIKELTDEFYNNPSPSNWNSLGELFEGIQWISTMFELVDQSTVRPSNWDEVTQQTIVMKDELENFEEAMKSTDTVLIADLLQYEILPVFETLSILVKQAIDTEGNRHDLN